MSYPQTTPSRGTPTATVQYRRPYPAIIKSACALAISQSLTTYVTYWQVLATVHVNVQPVPCDQSDCSAAPKLATPATYWATLHFCGTHVIIIESCLILMGFLNFFQSRTVLGDFWVASLFIHWPSLACGLSYSTGHSHTLPTVPCNNTGRCLQCHANF